MPKEKKLEGCIPKIYKRNAEDIMLFAWVNAQRQIVPTITQDQAMWNYLRFMEIDDWDIESMRVTLNRIQRDYYDDCREVT